METIRICKDRNLLKEYLESREMEVVTIMMSLFDEEEILKSYIACERKEAVETATKENKIETAKNLILIMQDKMSIGEISAATGLTEETVRSLKEEVMQLA
jgi:DNA-directed RNA polymerase specialized sigma24 family protein